MEEEKEVDEGGPMRRSLMRLVSQLAIAAPEQHHVKCFADIKAAEEKEP